MSEKSITYPCTTSEYSTSTAIESSPTSPYEEAGHKIGKLVDEKQKQYGDSFGHIEKVMKVLYPKGIKIYQLTDALAITRIIDKLFRIAQRGPEGHDLGRESPYSDIAGYGILGMVKDESNLKDLAKSL